MRRPCLEARRPSQLEERRHLIQNSPTEWQESWGGSSLRGPPTRLVDLADSTHLTFSFVPVPPWPRASAVLPAFLSTVSSRYLAPRASRSVPALRAHATNAA